MTRLDSSQRIALAGISVLLLMLALTAAIAVLSVIAAADAPDAVATAWKAHRAACLEIPQERYHLDRARAVRGLVHDPDGNPVPGALVRCVRGDALLELARSGAPTPENWSGLVETETRTDSEGRYEFPHLSQGSRMICASAAGFAPDVQGLVLVQDGSGARVDFRLESPRTLRVRVADADDRPLRIHLVPHRWWPELMSRDVNGEEAEVEFSGVGGPFRTGLVLVSDLSSGSSWEPKGRFEVDRSDEITISCTEEYTPSARDVPEAECVPAWQRETSEAGRRFFSLLTPVALFWQAGGSRPSAADLDLAHQIQAAGLDLVAHRPNSSRARGGLRGSGPSPFLPVLIESRDGPAWLEWTSEASEFELLGLPRGLYRVRSLNSYGRVSFARGAIVPASGVVDLGARPGSPIELDEPLSREVMGTVRWEDGRPADKAVVFLQDATNFRRFLKREVTNRNGYFRIPDVPAARYVAFALPPDDKRAMKSFVYPRVDAMPRETWLDLSLSPHRVIGRLPAAGSSRLVQLARVDPEGRERVVWSLTPADDGQFEITNVPHGQYVVRRARDGSAPGSASLPFVVEGDRTVTVRWPNDASIF